MWPHELHREPPAVPQRGWRVLDREIDWFILREGQYDNLLRDPSGPYKSEAFPGLWLDPAAMMRGDLASVLDTLRQGLTTPAGRTRDNSLTLSVTSTAPSDRAWPAINRSYAPISVPAAVARRASVVRRLWCHPPRSAPVRAAPRCQPRLDSISIVGILGAQLPRPYPRGPRERRWHPVTRRPP